MTHDTRTTHALAFALLVAAALPAHAVTLPPGFSAVPLSGTYNLPVLVKFTDDGAFTFLVEKAGVVWAHDGQTKSPTPVLDLSAEVNNDHDRGLLGFALHPGFTPDGGPRSYVYVLHTVTPVTGLDYAYNQDNRYSFSRLVRCRTTSQAGWPVALLTDDDGDGAPCQTLLGHRDASGRVNDGIASLHNSHSTADLHFGRDGTLLVLNGDGAHYDVQDNGGLDPAGFQGFTLAPPPGASAPWFGPMPAYEDSGAFRAQDLRSLAGKVLRIDPETGLGLPSNPFFTGNPADHASKVWAGGLRNPYRSALKPGTGATDPALGDPGTLYVGDVGLALWEDLHVVRSGTNAGWPRFEGFGTHASYSAFVRSPNPLGLPDGTRLGAASDPAAFRVHSPPIVAWHHSNAALLSPSGLHAGFRGNTAIGGDFYVGSAWPAEYQGAFFFADYGQSFLRALVVTGDDTPVRILDFATGAAGPVDIERHPVVGDLYYVSIFERRIYRIRYGTSSPPTAALTATPTLGASPLPVRLDATGSGDAEQATETLRFDWTLGDGTTLPDAGPVVDHTFLAAGTYTVTVTVRDFDGDTATASTTVDVDNSPPFAVILTPPHGSVFDEATTTALALAGTGLDAEDPPSALTYAWQVDLHHLDPFDASQDHVHPGTFALAGPTGTFLIGAHGGPEDIIAYELLLTVTDRAGASDTARSYVIPASIGVLPWQVADIGAAVGHETRVDLWGFDVHGDAAGATGASDALHYVYRPVTGSFTLVARAAGVTGDATEAVGGVMLRTSLAPDAPFLAAFVDPDGTVSAWRRDTVGAAALPGATAAGVLPDVWLRLARTGGTVQLDVSTDGTAFAPLLTSTAALPDTVSVGFPVASGASSLPTVLALRDIELAYTRACGDHVVDPGEACDDGNLADGDCCSSACAEEPVGSACGPAEACDVHLCAAGGVCAHVAVTGPCSDGDPCTLGDACAAGVCVAGAPAACDDGNPCTIDACAAGVGCVATPDPGCSDPLAPWTATDIGGVLPAGSTSAVPGGYDLRGGGPDLWGNADRFHFLHRAVTGDFELRARVESLQNTNVWAKAGLVVRTGTGAGDPYVALLATNAQGWRFQRRLTAGGWPAQVVGPAVPWPNGWARLTRVGNVVTAATSPDGATWTTLASATLPLPGTALVGMAVTSKDTRLLARAALRDVALVGAGGAGGGAVCGNGLREAGEACDDGNTRAGDCCGATCAAEPAGSPCTDGDACTEEACDGAARCVAQPLACADGNPCTDEVCDPALGCLNVANTAACDDANPCTTADTCAAGACVGGAAPVCDDGDACTVDACVAGLGCRSSVIPGCLPPSTFLAADVGGALPAGDRTAVPGGHDVRGGGADIWGTADAFHFEYRTVTGDFDVRARVASLGATNFWAKAGLMARAALTADSRYAATLATVGGGFRFQRRLTDGAWPRETQGGPLTWPNAWVRLTRVGAAFTAFVSADGATWTTVDSATIAMPASVFVGLATCSHDVRVLTTAAFRDLLGL